MENERVEIMKAPKAPSGTETTKNSWGHCVTPGPQGPLTSSKSEGPMDPASGVIGSFIGMGIAGFWFGIGFMLAVKTVNNLEEIIRR